MNNKSRKVYVVGHKNPDTDSICSAMAYAYLKTMITGRDHSPRRAGLLNEETKYVLERFDVKPPKLLVDVKLQVRDVDIHMIEGTGPNASVRQAWSLLKKQGMKTLPVSENGELMGIITAGDIAETYMSVYEDTILSKAKTPFQNIVDTLGGKILTGDINQTFESGKVAIGASDPQLMMNFLNEGDLVILGNRYESHSCAIDVNVRCIVVCQNADVSPILLQRAQSQGIVIIQTPYDTFNVAKLINQSIPVKHFMTRKENLYTFHTSDYVDEIREIITKKTFREFPILNHNDKLVGFISRRRVMNVNKKEVILVDHNEKSQAVDGLDEAEILEIIDHHRLGNIQTMGPVYFRNQPVGCTATIIYQLYQENDLEIPAQVAGIMCAAIISDTLMFRSPTCTPLDVSTAKKLAKIANIDIEEFAIEMFKAGSNLEGKTAKEICFRDFKKFPIDDMTIGVGQISSMNEEELKQTKKLLEEFLPSVPAREGLDMVFFMLTNILTETSEILCYGQGALKAAIEAFELPEDVGDIVLKKVVSRKKQVVPALVNSIHH